MTSAFSAIDTFAGLPAYYPPQLLHFMRTYGQDKVLFGSNFPQLSLKKCLEQVRALELPPAIADKFVQGNARRVFGL
ncbi:amidohydrolase family protein [Pseudomonas protegens]|nr:amidohydrolase family protein [Pseudomonas protegens]